LCREVHDAQLYFLKLIYVKVCLFICSTSALFGSEVAELIIKKDAVLFKAVQGIAKYSVHISGPKLYSLEKTVHTSDMNITSFGEDGRYKYQLTEHIKPTKKQMGMNDRERNSLSSFTPTTVARKQYGHFMIKMGKPVQETLINER